MVAVSESTQNNMSVIATDWLQLLLLVHYKDGFSLWEASFCHSFINSFILFYKRHDKIQANKQCTKINNTQKYTKTNNSFDIACE